MQQTSLSQLDPKSHKTASILGIDACRGGWIICATHKCTRGNLAKPRFYFAKALNDCLYLLHNATLIFIDMPIGLPTARTYPRCCDQLAKRALGKRHSTIFYPPLREVLYCDSYETANEAQRQLIGKGLSKQTWNITPRIRELNELMEAHNAIPFRESHPELCFAGIKGGQALKSSKHTSEGQEERLVLLKELHSEFPLLLSEWLQESKSRKSVMIDLIDASILACAAFYCSTKADEWVQLQTSSPGTQPAPSLSYWQRKSS